MEQYNDFMCSHKSEEGKTDALETWFDENIRTQAEDIGAEYQEEYINQSLKYPISYIVYSLLNYNVDIDGIPADQWGAVSAVKTKYDRETKTSTVIWRAFVQCDIIEHGFMAIYKYVVENFDGS